MVDVVLAILGGWGISSGVGGRYVLFSSSTASSSSSSANDTGPMSAMDLYHNLQDMFSNLRPSFSDSLHFVNTVTKTFSVCVRREKRNRLTSPEKGKGVFTVELPDGIGGHCEDGARQGL